MTKRDLEYLRGFLRQLPPHVKDREMAKCLADAVELIGVLQEQIKTIGATLDAVYQIREKCQDETTVKQ